MANPASHLNRANRESIVHEEGNSVRIGNRKGMKKGRGEAEGGQSRSKIGMRDPVVSFFLVQEDESAVERVLSHIAQNVAEEHGNVSSIAIPNKASLMRRDQSRKYSGQTGSKQSGIDFDIAIGQRDWAPVGQ